MSEGGVGVVVRAFSILLRFWVEPMGVPVHPSTAAFLHGGEERGRAGQQKVRRKWVEQFRW